MLEVTVNDRINHAPLPNPFLFEWSLRLTQLQANPPLYSRFFIEAISELRFSWKG